MSDLPSPPDALHDLGRWAFWIVGSIAVPSMVAWLTSFAQNRELRRQFDSKAKADLRVAASQLYERLTPFYLVCADRFYEADEWLDSRGSRGSIPISEDLGLHNGLTAAAAQIGNDVAGRLVRLRSFLDFATGLRRDAAEHGDSEHVAGVMRSIFAALLEEARSLMVAVQRDTRVNHALRPQPDQGRIGEPASEFMKLYRGD